LINFISENNISYYRLNDVGQNYVELQTILSWEMIDFTNQKVPCVRFSMSNQIPSGEGGAFVLGKLQGNLGYENPTIRFDLSGQTFSFVLDKNEHKKYQTYAAPTSLKLFSHLSKIIIEPGYFVNTMQTFVIPFSEIKKLSPDKIKIFTRLFDNLQSGRL
jgi:hypothetical protein